MILSCLRLILSCRASELTTLTWDNVSINDRFLIIRNSLSKNKKTVYKPINDTSFDALIRLKTHRKYVFTIPKLIIT